MFESLELCYARSGQGIMFASGLAQKGLSDSLTRPLLRHVLNGIQGFKKEAKKLPKSPRRSQMLAVAKAIDRCVRKLCSRALRDPKVSLLHGFVLLHLSTGIEYLLIGSLAVDPPGFKNYPINALTDLTTKLDRLNIRIVLPKTLEECPAFLMNEMKHHLSFSWSVPIEVRVYQREEHNSP
jgi:hypothetical protein